MWHNHTAPFKPVVWLGDSLRALKSFPSAVQDEVGYALFLAQRGEKHLAAKPMKGLGAGVFEVADHRGNTFRAVCISCASPTASTSCTRSRRKQSTASQRLRPRSI